MKTMLRLVVESRLVVLALAFLVMAAGWFTWQQLPVDAFPDVSPNLVQVFTVTDGLAPEEIETWVTFPIETAMNGLPGVRKIRSISNFGLSVVSIYFRDDVDIWFARQLVGERLQEAREQIPEGFGDPQLGPISTGMGLVLFYYLDDPEGRYSLEELRTLQDWLVKIHLQKVPGVTEVLGIGGWEKQFHVEVDPDALLRYDVTIDEVIAAIRANNLNVGAQFIERNAEELVVRSIGLATGVDDLQRIVLRAVDGTPVWLRDVARIRVGGAVRRGVQTRNGVGEVVAGQVIKLFGTNASTVIAAVERKVEEINEILPEGVRIVPYYEQKSLVEAAVRTVVDALVQGIILVVIVLLLFMGGFRPSLVVALSIPFSVLATFIGMRQLGLSANLMSLGGLAIAIGMMVDGTIVMVENIDRVLRTAPAGESPREIAVRAGAEVARPILFAVTIVVVVFLPLFTLRGVEGKTFRPLAWTFALAMAGSLAWALLVAPALSSLLLRRPRAAGPGLADRFLALLGRVYEPLLRGFARRRILPLLLALFLLAGGSAVIPFLGSEFTPTLQEGTMVVRLTMAPSIALTESTRIALSVERKLMALPEVRSVVTRIGRGEVGAHTDPVNSAEMYLLLAPRERWRVGNQEELEELVRQHLGVIPGVLVNFTQPIEMTVDELLEGVRAQLAIKVFGEDLATLERTANEIAAVVRTVPGAADVQVDQLAGSPQLLIRVNREAIARWGLDVATVQETIRAAVGGAVAGQVFEGIRRFDILVRYPEGRRNTRGAIESILVRGPGGIRVPLGELVEVSEVIGPRQVTREDGQRFATVQCNVAGRDIGSFVAEAQDAIRQRVPLPPGYLVTWGGQFELQQQANRRLALVVPITLLLVFLLLHAAFGSVRRTLLIVANIPLALVGGVVSLALSGQDLSVPASVGFISLFGIALGNGMVLISAMDRLAAGGLSPIEAAVQGALLRLRPVLMTATTTALGLAPLLLASGTGSEVQRPLATVVLGGLATSTVLTLLVLPAFYPVIAGEARER